MRNFFYCYAIVVAGCFTQGCFPKVVGNSIKQYEGDVVSSFSVMHIRSKPATLDTKITLPEDFYTYAKNFPRSYSFIVFHFSLDSAYSLLEVFSYNRALDTTNRWFRKYNTAVVPGPPRLLKYLKKKWNKHELIIGRQSTLLIDTTNGIYLLQKIYRYKPLSEKRFFRSYP